MNQLNSRRKFIKNLALSGILLKINLFNSCNTNSQLPQSPIEWLNSKEFYLIIQLFETMFPNNGNGPNCSQINAIPHFIWTYEKVYPKEVRNKYVIPRIKKTIEILKEYGYNTLQKISTTEWNEIVKVLTIDKQTKKLISKIQSIVFESLVIDPIYNVNSDEIGWKWLNHTPGVPRPNDSNKFPNYYQKS